MTVFDIAEFLDWQKSSGLNEYIFDSDNNDWLTSCCFHVCMRFPTVSVSMAFHRIIFQNGNNYLDLEHVKEIILYDDCDTVGTVFDVVCEPTDGQKKCWRFLAD